MPSSSCRPPSSTPSAPLWASSTSNPRATKAARKKSRADPSSLTISTLGIRGRSGSAQEISHHGADAQPLVVMKESIRAGQPGGIMPIDPRYHYDGHRCINRPQGPDERLAIRLLRAMRYHGVGVVSAKDCYGLFAALALEHLRARKLPEQRLRQEK